MGADQVAVPAVRSEQGTVLSVSVGGPRRFEYKGRPVQSAIWKHAVQGRVEARGVNLEGDDQADRGAFGGPTRRSTPTRSRTFAGGRASSAGRWPRPSSART